MNSQNVRDIMDQFLQVPIFEVSKKLRMSKYNENDLLNPNLTMDIRHSYNRDHNHMSTNSTCYSLLKENRRILPNELQINNNKKLEEKRLNIEFQEFKKQLDSCRLKMRASNMTHKVNLFNLINDNKFLETSYSTEKKSTDLIKQKNDYEQYDQNEVKDTDNLMRNNVSVTTQYPGDIKITIREKQEKSLNNEHNRELLFKTFNGLRIYTKEKRRRRNMTMKLQNLIQYHLLKKYFNQWRVELKTRKQYKLQKETKSNVTDQEKIEIFIQTLKEKQKQKKSIQVLRSNAENVPISNSIDECKNNISRKNVIRTFAHNRLAAQRKIIEQQRLKLVEQNKIIEQLKIKRVQNDIKNPQASFTEIANILKNCEVKTRRNLVHLMQKERYNKITECETHVSCQVNSPIFLSQMETRAEARKERMKRAEEERLKKLEEQRKNEEIARRVETENRQRLRQEARREALRLLQEQEKIRLHKLDRNRACNEILSRFNRKFLLQRYGINPLKSLIIARNNLIQTAEIYYRKVLLKKVLLFWKIETENQYKTKNQLAIDTYKNSLLTSFFNEWVKFLRHERQNYQVAKDFHDMRLQDKYFKLWHRTILDIKIERLKNEQVAYEHVKYKLKRKYFSIWTRYRDLFEIIKESEKRKQRWREIVKEVIPDFSPVQRGVVVE